MRINSKLLILFLYVLLRTLSAQETSSTFFKNADEFFKKNVVNGRVDYSSIKDNPAELNRLVRILSKSNLSKLQKEDQDKALLINIYNILVIKAVLKYYPLKSVMDIGGFFDKDIINIAGEDFSLNKIERKILFKNYPDPRLHFVLVCAAIGCPQIINNAYFPGSLEKLLDQRTRVTMSNINYLRVEPNSKTVFVSELFKWYEKDFTKNNLSIIQYINQYREVKIPENYTVSYITYDWSLNDIHQIETGSLLPRQENLQAYTPSTLLKPGQIELKFFNNVYTQTAFFNEESKKIVQNGRATFYTGIINSLYGVTSNFNIGIDIYIKSVRNDNESSSPFSVFKFSSDANSRSAFAQFGPKIKISPFASFRNLAIQSVFLFPLVSNLDGSPFLDVDGNQWWTQIFYDHSFGNSFLLYLESGLFFRFGSEFEDFYTPLKTFLNYYPSQDWTIYFLVEFTSFWKESSISAHYTQLGFGGKYQFSSNFELEILYTKFIIGKSQGAGETYNLGIRIII